MLHGEMDICDTLLLLTLLYTWNVHLLQIYLLLNEEENIEIGDGRCVHVIDVAISRRLHSNIFKI